MKRASIVGLVVVLLLSIGAAALAEADEPVPNRPHVGVGNMRYFTTAGPMSADEVGNVLAHHHMFVEFGAVPPVEYSSADPDIVYDVIGPWVEEARDNLGQGGVFVEPTPLGVGRRPDIVKHVADTAGLPTMLVTGIYREPWIPDWVFEASVGEIAEFLWDELQNGVGDTGVPAGFIKLSQNDSGITQTEMKVLEAACIVARRSGATIGSHITFGPTALAVMDALEEFGCDPARYRFVWIHSQWTAWAEPDGVDFLLEAAERGAYLSLDGIGSVFWGLPGAGGFDENLGWIETLAAAGYEDQIIIGADTGWFDPGDPPFPGFEIEEVDGDWRPAGVAGVDGYLMQDYNSIFEFVEFLETEGVSGELIQKLMEENPWHAYSRKPVRGTCCQP